jgi:hypothetical protein
MSEAKKSDIIKVVLALLVILMATYIFVEPGKPDYNFDQGMINKVDSLDSINRQLLFENSKLDSMVEHYNNVITDLDWRLEELAKRKQETSDYYDKKLDGSKEYTTTEIDSFFINRYQYENP